MTTASTVSSPFGPVTCTADADAVDVFGLLEVTVAIGGPPAGNPFTDRELRGEFTAEGGETVAVAGFCDAEDGMTYRVRFMPRRAGRHRYRLFLQTPAGETVVGEGNFEAHDAGRRGPLRVDPEHPWHFVHEGTGEHFFYNGTTTYWLLGWDESEFAPILDRLAGLGVNRIRIGLCGRVESGRSWDEDVFASDKFSFRLNPWLAARPESVEDPGFDVTRFNLSHWRKAEKLLSLAAARGISVSVIFYIDGAKPGVEPFGKAGAGGPDEQRYYRYAAARLSTFANLTWDVTNEYRLFRDDDWAKRMGAFLKSCDPYDHLMSVHGHGTFTFRTEPWADFAMYQSWDEHGGYGYLRENRRLQEETGRVIPQVNEEYGYEDHYPQGWGGARVAPARASDNRRRLAWEIYMAGGYQTTGERATPCGGWINGKGCDDSTEMLAGNAHIRRFFESFAWWRTNPADGVAEAENGVAYCLAEPGQQYAVYLPDAAAPLRLRLAPGRYKASWFDPLTGQPLPLTGVDASADAPYTPPGPPFAGDGKDGVLLLTAAG